MNKAESPTRAKIPKKTTWKERDYIYMTVEKNSATRTTCFS